MTKGQVISGEFGRIIARQKFGQQIEIGELLIADSDNGKIMLQVYDLVYGSQISQQNLEMIAGMKLEENTDFEDRKSTRLNSSHSAKSRMPSSA